MGTQTKSTFTRYELEDEEILNASILRLSQAQLFQNDLADIADQILGLKFEPANPGEFAQQDAFLKGQLQVYRYLLERSEAAVVALKNLSQSAN